MGERPCFDLPLAAAALLTATVGAQAQSNWPNKPVKILVPTAAGGTADNTARMFAQYVEQDARPAVLCREPRRRRQHARHRLRWCARRPTATRCCLAPAPIAINHLIYKKLPYDVLRDLTPVTQMISLPNVLVVHPSQPMKSLADYIAAAKAAPSKIDYASAGIGSNLHMAMELLKFRTGIEVTHVPYKGVGPALQDTLAGHVMSMVSNAASAKPHIDAGKIRALGVTSLQRSPAMPDVPTIDEQGVKGYEVLNWFGPVAPAGTPKEIVDKLQAEAAAMMNDPKTREMLSGEGAEPVASKPEVFAAFVREEIKKWDEVGKAANIQPTE